MDGRSRLLICTGVFFVAIGMIVSAYFLNIFTSEVNSNNVITTDAHVITGKSYVVREEIKNTAGKVTLIIQALPSKVLLQSVVTDPMNKAIDKQVFTNRLQLKYDNLSPGYYTFKVTNLGNQNVTMDLFFGHLPLSITYPHLISGLVMGVLLALVGIFFIVLGCLFRVKDLKRPIGKFPSAS